MAATQPPPAGANATANANASANVAAAPVPAPVPATPTSTLPAGTRTAPVVPGRPGRVFIFAGVDKACAALPEPQVQVSKPPAKGDISFKPGQATTIAASASGTCLGSKATGTGVYYTARPGTSGADSFALTAKLATGETMTRDFTVTISE